MTTDINIQKIVNVYHMTQQQWNRNFFAPRSFDAVVLFTEGEIEYRFAAKTVIARKGDLLFLPGNLPYSGQKHTDTVGFFVCDFVCGTEDEFEHFGAPVAFTPPNYDMVLSGFSKAVECWEKQQTDVHLKLKSVMYGMLCELFKNTNTQKTTIPTEDILAYIAENIGDATLSVRQLCGRFYISESQLRRNMLKATGLKPGEYILLLRLNKAKNMLTYTEVSVKQIAAECGFSSPYYFSRCFSEQVGVSPRAYRQSRSTI